MIGGGCTAGGNPRELSPSAGWAPGPRAPISDVAAVPGHEAVHDRADGRAMDKERGQHDRQA